MAPPPPKSTPAAPPRQLSYDEFIQQHGPPKTHAPRPRTSTAPRRSAPRIDTHFNVDLTDAIRTRGSVSGSSEAARTAVNLYVAALNDQLKSAWQNPQLELTTVVEFEVAGNGRISRVRITKGSGNASFDDSVLAAFQEVGSAGPTPDGEPLELRFRFNGISP